ncbi:sensor histidine kinase [Sphingomicrobium astaxanthinifaciens]|uniref:sensor histidine kinase n=1 Tax=Sphingomicrobium astaxanthinifaciens TaxID=1227949 RepID=UPI001FCC42E3|nr:HAMP domain-containing sensor histidine kinase [Sphingomicrobium astaxanthinifaciens]MCJ7422169.1 HAMP domain-containing histidine kinase [Sphingomicrobium astaxanthinifaciens]
MSESIRHDPAGLPCHGRTDAEGRLVAADAPLYALQAAAGARLGQPLAVPQLRAVVSEALRLQRDLRRAIVAADETQDYELRVRVTPRDAGARITIEAMRPRPRGEARFTAEPDNDEAPDFTVDVRMRLTDVRPAIARRFGVDLDTLPCPFTELATLLPDKDGSLPFLDALARGSGFERQRAMVRARDFHFAFAGRPLVEAGEVTGFAMTVLGAGVPEQPPEEHFDDTLRTPLTRIIAAADQIVDRSDGPLRSDYANYAGDIATAGRHLLSVIRSIGKAAGDTREDVDLVELAREAAAMASAEARAKAVEIELEEHDGALVAAGEPRGVLQILVNVIGNAVEHSPEGGTVAVVFDEDNRDVSVTVADQGPGIARADQGRIFEAYERLGPRGDKHAGLGLAISRRLARSMRGDLGLESALGEGARFTLKLPRP